MADSKIKFKEFCDLCETLQKCQKFTEKENVLTKFINKYKELDSTLLENNEITETTFFPVLRLLSPDYDRKRSAYGLKETAFAKLYIRSLGLRGADANSLTNFTKTNLNVKSITDFADVAYWVLRKWCPSSSSLTIADVNEHLDQMAKKYAEHLPREVEKELGKMVKMSTAVEQKWIIRIILKYMRLGMGSERILKIFHPDAPQLYDVSNDLVKICSTLKDPSLRSHVFEIAVFTAFRPMLSLECNVNELNKTVKGNKVFYVENKYDGERFQLHMENGQFKYFSRNGYDYTKNYGGNYQSNGLLTKYLEKTFSHIQSVILDGEMLLWNKKNNCLGSKGMKHDVKKLTSDSTYRPCFCVFDILLLNGRVLTNESLSTRLNILDTLFEPIDGVLRKSPRFEIKTKQELLDELNRAVDREDEGICFKDPDSLYKPNDRKSGWWKMKLEYYDGLMTELDVLIIGGNYGDGKQRSCINSFLVGVAEKPTTGDTPTVFHSFNRVSSGINHEDRDKLFSMLQNHWKPFDKKNPPAEILTRKEKPDLWIEPKNSCILQIKASELVRSFEYQTDYTLRFPRVEKVRFDKPWYNCLTVDELNELTKSNRAVEKLSGRHLTQGDIDILPVKRARVEPLSYLTNVEQKSNLLAGKEFCVLTGNEQNPKSDVEVSIKEFGGKVVQFAGPNTFCTLIGDVTPKAKSLISTSTSDIVKLDWFIKFLRQPSRKLLQFTPEDLIVTSAKTKILLSDCFDKYGDSYTQPATKESLRKVLDNLNKEGDYLNLMPSEFIAFDRELQFTNKLGLFRSCYVYFDTNEQNDRICYLETAFLFYGGNKCQNIEDYTTHIVSDDSKPKSINNVGKVTKENIEVVNYSWIEECLKEKRLLSKDAFVV